VRCHAPCPMLLRMGGSFAPPLSVVWFLVWIGVLDGVLEGDFGVNFVSLCSWCVWRSDYRVGLCRSAWCVHVGFGAFVGFNMTGCFLWLVWFRRVVFGRELSRRGRVWRICGDHGEEFVQAGASYGYACWRTFLDYAQEHVLLFMRLSFVDRVEH
jgi:hypothetical protein